MDLLDNISKRIRSESNWIDVAKQIGIDVNDIDKIKKKNNCAAEFVYSLTNKIWNVIFQYLNITLSKNDFVNITNMGKLGKIIAGDIKNDIKKSEIDKNLLKEIASRLGNWEKFARILGLEESDIHAIEKLFPSPGLYIQRTLEVMKKFSHPLPPTTSLEFWRQYLKQFEDGKVVIGEIEMNFPNLMVEVSDTGEHMISGDFVYFGHLFDYKDWQSKATNSKIDNEVIIPDRLGPGNFVDFQNISQWIDTQQQYSDHYNILKEINVFNFTYLGDNKVPILTTLKSYLDNTNDSGFVLKGYHFVDHICLFKPGLFKKDLFDDHYFCFVANDGVVLYITECSQGKGNALYHSIRNVQIANLLHKELNSSEILQINVIVHDDDRDGQFCKTCIGKKLYVKENVFNDPEKFALWYKDVLCKRKYKLKPSSKGNNEDINIICQHIKTEILTYEALDNNALPSFSYCPEDQVEELEKIILLTPQQQIVLYSDEGHILIRGCYGSGKTVVLHKKFENVVTNGHVEDIYYLICNDQQSELVHYMRRIQSKFPNKHIIICQSRDILPSLVLPNISNILDALRSLWKDKTIHVFIDEFNGCFIDKEEVMKVGKVLIFFRNSHVVIALQSMEEHTDATNIEEPVDIGYQYQLLTEQTSFYCFNFEHSLRSSFEINEFVKITSQYVESIKQASSSTNNYQSVGRFIDKEYGMENCNSINKPSSKLWLGTFYQHFLRFLQEKLLRQQDSTQKSGGEPVLEKEYGIENYDSFNNVSSKPWLETFYRPFRRFLPGNLLPRQGSMQILGIPIKTHYTFNQSTKVTNKIYCGCVSVYFFDKSSSAIPKNVSLIYVSALKYILDEVSVNKRFVICIYDESLYNAVFSFLEQSDFEWTSKISEFVKLKVTFEILLTDYASVRGYEFPNLILMVPLGVRYLKYRIIECVTRATANLHVITDNCPKADRLFERLSFFLWDLFDTNIPVETELVKTWQESEFTDFHVIKFDKNADSITILENEKEVYVEKNVTSMNFKETGRFPWHRAVALQAGKYPAECAFLVIENLLINDNVGLLNEFLENNHIDIRKFNTFWMADLLGLAIKHKARMCLCSFIHNYGFDIFDNSTLTNAALKSAVQGNDLLIFNTLVKRQSKYENIFHGYQTVSHILTDENSNVNLKNSDGNTLLYEAACRGDTFLVNVLLAKKADIHASNKYGNTALHAAVYKKNIGIIAILLKENANLYVKNNFGKDPFDEAQTHGIDLRVMRTAMHLREVWNFIV